MWLKLRRVWICMVVLLGLGALVGNQVGTIVGGVVYVLVVEIVLNAVMRINDLGQIPPYLPNKSSGDMVSTLAFDLFTETAPRGPFSVARMDSQLRELFGLQYSPAWWASGLVFVGWTAVFGIVGHLTARRRDIT
ncbi:hypothetical protein ACFQ1S_16530 [Kibdelosporangium lantanae]|uniref:Uncharacterized protein n=1 Tax=Kibdelosporangium lantanae TaxID=1497396 RepID=A0ABW3M9K4_9PSEU